MTYDSMMSRQFDSLWLSDFISCLTVRAGHVIHPMSLRKLSVVP